MRYESPRPERPFGITAIVRDCSPSCSCVLNRRYDDLGWNALELHDSAGTSGVGTTTAYLGGLRADVTTAFASM